METKLYNVFKNCKIIAEGIPHEDVLKYYSNPIDNYLIRNVGQW